MRYWTGKWKPIYNAGAYHVKYRILGLAYNSVIVIKFGDNIDKEVNRTILIKFPDNEDDLEIIRVTKVGYCLLP